MAEVEEVKSKRDQFGERLKKKYPDREYADDEALFGQIGDDYDEYENSINGYKEREGKLTDLLAKDPHSAQFITDMASGKDPWGSLINRIGIDGVKEMLEDPSKIDEYAERNKEYVERVARQKELEEQWRSNMEETLDMLSRKQEETGMSAEQMDEAADWIKEVVNDAIVGIIKPETIDMAVKAINYDADVEEADYEGEVRGRNEKIEAKLRKPAKGDGVPFLGAANNAPAPSTRRESIFDVADGAK